MRPVFSAEDEAFRAEVVEFLADWRDLDGFGELFDRPGPVTRIECLRAARLVRGRVLQQVRDFPHQRIDGREIDLTGKVVLCFGGVEKGLRARTRQICDGMIGLPMRGRVGSLNIATAAAAVLYEAVRQRQSLPASGEKG